jgi:hypothetical protein
MACDRQPDKLLCPCCGKSRAVADTTLLRAEAEWLATGEKEKVGKGSGKRCQKGVKKGVKKGVRTLFILIA